MVGDIDLGGTIYISSKKAAELAGYTQDYVGQLARNGAVEAKRVSGLWYVLESSLMAYKEKAEEYVPKTPVPPKNTTEAEVTVTFDGKDYISAHRAAKITGYNQDYVGQLARTGQILSRQVGKRWYVDRESLLSHKKSKDEMLAKVQRDAVGLLDGKPEDKIEKIGNGDEEESTHFSYIPAEEVQLPNLMEKVPSPPNFKDASPYLDAETLKNEVGLTYDTTPNQPEAIDEVENVIPIRIISENDTNTAEITYYDEKKTYSRGKLIRVSLFTTIACIVLAASVYFVPTFVLNNSEVAESGQNQATNATKIVKNTLQAAKIMITGALGREIVYKREK